jgi:hypothetical protein
VWQASPVDGAIKQVEKAPWLTVTVVESIDTVSSAFRNAREVPR